MGMSASQTLMPHRVRSMVKMEQKGNPIQLKARREEEKEVGRPLIHVFKIQTVPEFFSRQWCRRKKTRAGGQRLESRIEM